MKKNSSLLIAVLCCFVADVSQASYSTFSLGFQNLKYTETTKYINPANANFGKTLKTSTTLRSPVYRTGGLTKVSDDFDFSLDAITTLLPKDATEEWKVGGSISQTNQVDMLHSNLILMGHFLLNEKHRLLVGTSYILNTFKRFDFPTDKLGVIEERSASLMLNFGYGFETNRSSLPKGSFSASFKVFVGIPVYQLTTNTSYPGFEYDNTDGYNFDLEGSVAVPVWKKLELGLFAAFSYMKRDGQRIFTDQFPGYQSIIWPENETSAFSGGVFLLWRL